MKEKNYKRLRAEARVKRIKGFYIHLMIFSIFMTAVLILGWNDIRVCFICFKNSDAVSNLLSFAPWGVGLALHGLVALGKIPTFDRWEERKMRQFMDE
jgi:hypothetical protein